MANANSAAQQINDPWFESRPAASYSWDFKVLAKDKTCYLLIHIIGQPHQAKALRRVLSVGFYKSRTRWRLTVPL